MRGYSLRSSYPLARSSQARRRLMLLNKHYQNAETEEAEPAETPEPVTLDPSDLEPWWDESFDSEEEDNRRTYDAEELQPARKLPSPPSSPQPPAPQELDLVDSQAFVDELFEEAESRNRALQSGAVSESVLDDEESDQAASLPWDDSILANAAGDESIIISGPADESRVFSREDLDNMPAEELPGSEPSSDRQPHFPTWYVPNLKTVKRLLDGEKPVTWMFAGESAASAADLAQGRRNFTDHFSERIRTELGRMLDVVINTGDTSETCQNLLKNIEWRVLRFHPEVVSILLGRNDANRGPAGRDDFQNSLEQIVQIVRESGSILVLHTPNRIDFSKTPHLSDLPNYVRIIRDVAKAYGIPLVDHWEHWKQQKPDPEALKTWLSADGVQPGVYGHREMAKLLFRHFEIFDPQSPICNARVP